MTYASANMVSNESALREFTMERRGIFSATKPKMYFHFCFVVFFK